MGEEPRLSRTVAVTGKILSRKTPCLLEFDKDRSRETHSGASTYFILGSILHESLSFK